MFVMMITAALISKHRLQTESAASVGGSVRSPPARQFSQFSELFGRGALLYLCLCSCVCYQPKLATAVSLICAHCSCTTRFQKMRKSFFKYLKPSFKSRFLGWRATACVLSFLACAAFLHRIGRGHRELVLSKSDEKLVPGAHTVLSVRRDSRGPGKPISLVFDKRAKTGSTSVNAILRILFKGKKFIDCGLHGPALAMRKMLEQTETGGFDVYDCHIGTSWEDRQVIEHRARFPTAWMTVTRDPFERLMSHFKHALRAGDNAPSNCVDIQLDHLLGFYQSVHQEYLLSEFGNYQTLHDEVSTGKVCSRWDIILESKSLSEDVSKFLGYSKLPKLNVTPSFCGNLTNEEAQTVKRVLSEEYLYHRALLDCKKRNKVLRLSDGNLVLT